ncbi:MAG TPA: outer membrane protein assembly factor BamD [Lichenihabitans sp.]|jgi:outer membrane protein assembly factor BamD|nr:outer membrane protein assembly factor BamD [Lichenihabitans sp.]
MDGSRLRNVGRLIPVAALLALGLSGCSELDSINPFGSGPKYETKILPEMPASDIYDQGLARLQKKDSSGAAKKFGELDKQYPFTEWSRKGLMMTTFAQYQGGDYDAAIASAKRYYGLYPQTPDAPYALYLMGMSYYNQIPDISRDQDESAKALEVFGQIVAKYPTSEYADDAKFKIQVTRDQLAGKEMSVGRFYLTRKNYVAAINRFREVLSKYQTTRHAEEALERLTEAYMGLGITNEAQTAAAVLGHNFPDSPWYKDAFNLLQGNGLEPHEDPASWISKVFHSLT